MSWYRIEFKRKHLILGRYYGADVDTALHYIEKWSEEVKRYPEGQFRVHIRTNDKAFSSRLNQTV